MTLLSRPGVYDLRKSQFANNFQLLSGLNQVFQEILFVVYCIWLSGLYCAGSQVGCYMGRPDPGVLCRLRLILRETAKWRSPPIAWLPHSANPLSVLPVWEGGLDRMKHSLVTFINPLIPLFPPTPPQPNPTPLSSHPTKSPSFFSFLPYINPQFSLSHPLKPKSSPFCIMLHLNW